MRALCDLSIPYIAANKDKQMTWLVQCPAINVPARDLIEMPGTTGTICWYYTRV